MKKLLTTIEQANPIHLFWLIVAASIVLAARMQAIQHGWINPDSVLYLEAAKLIVIGDFRGAYNIFGWPFYALCIGIVSKLTGLGVHLSAQFLNMVFFGIATASFLKIIQLAGGKNLTLFAGALLLFGNLYIVGDVLEMLMRDEGFWAFYLTALVCFIRYLQHEKVSDAILWQVSIIIATLFRIEAILFLLFLPLITLWIKSSTIKEKFQLLLTVYSLSLVIGLVIVTAILTQPQISMAQFGRLNEIFNANLYYEFTKLLFAQADKMSNLVLGSYLEEFAIPGLLLTFLYVIGSKILTAAGWIGTGLALVGFKHSSKKIPITVRSILLTTCAIALFIMALIIIKVFVLSSRYVVSLAWILLVFASFQLAELSSNSGKKQRTLFIIICITLCLCFVKNILPKREGYNYQQNAVSWIKSHNTQNQAVFYDDSRVRYYAKQPFEGTGIANLVELTNAYNNKSINNYHYLVINSSKERNESEQFISSQLPNFSEIKRISSYKGKKQIVIYRKTTK
jgi:hypothetical protein